MSSTAVLYIITVVISILIAVLLSYLANQSSQAKAEEDKKRREVENSGASSFDSFSAAMSDKVNKLVDSAKSKEEIAKAVSDVFAKELEKKIELTAREVGKKYEKIIEEKGHSEEIAWKKYKKELSEKKQTEAVIRSIAEGLVVVDAKGKVIMMNPAAETLLGVSMKEKRGKSISENLKEEQLISLTKGSPEGAEGGEIELISQRDETKKILRASSAVIENENGKTVGMVSVFSDITKQKELENMKSIFVANVSHELRTPLVAVEKSVSMILSKAAGQISGTQEELLSIAERNLKRLSRLINDLLDMSKIEAGKLELKYEPYSAGDIINECINSLTTWAETKRISMVKKVEQDLPKVNIDPGRIIQVLTNLIGNAIKFTPDNGTITVEASLRKEKACLEISIADTGIGIDKESISKVFDKFYQIGERTPTDIGGTGIGLSIAKEIVEMHDGKIWAESEKGRGAKFVFTLPLKKSEVRHE